MDSVELENLKNLLAQQAPPENPYMSAMSPEQAQLLENLKKVGSMKVEAKAAPKMIQPSATGSLEAKPQMPGTAINQVALPYTDEQHYKDIFNNREALANRAAEEQRTGIAQMDQNLRDYKNAPQAVDFSALANYFDSTVPGSKLAQGYRPPESASDKQFKIAQLEEAIQKARAGMTDKELEAMKIQLDRLDPDKKALMQEKIDWYRRGGNPAMRQEDRLAQQAHNQVLNKLDHNKLLQTKLNQIQGLDNAGKIIEEAPVVSPTIFNDYQQAVVSAVQRGNSGIGERAERYLTSAGIDAAKVQQFLTGKPVDIGKDNALLKAMQGFAKTERKNIERQYGDIVGAVTSGQEHVYAKHPEMKKSLQNAIKSYKGMAADGQPAAGGPQVGEEVDGHIYQGGDPSDPANWEAQ